MSGSSSLYVTTLPSLMVIGTVVIEMCFYFVTLSHKTTRLKDYVTISVGPPHGKSPTCEVGWLQVLWCWIYNSFSLSRDLVRQRDERLVRLYGQQPVKVSYHPAQCGCHRHSGYGDIFLVCDVIVQGHMIIGSFHVMGGCFSR